MINYRADVRTPRPDQNQPRRRPWPMRALSPSCWHPGGNDDAIEGQSKMTIHDFRPFSAIRLFAFREGIHFGTEPPVDGPCISILPMLL